MYVDNTDLLHWTPSLTTTAAELVNQVQAATTDWGMLTQATGGALKPEKCFLYLFHYNFEKGRAKMKTLRQLPRPLTHVVLATGPPQPSHITVPQPNGDAASIPTIDCKTDMEMLGIFFAPASDGTAHIQQMCKKGFTWADRLKAKPLPTRDA